MSTHPLHTRRDFLAGISSGFAGVALSQMLARDAVGSTLSKPELNGGIHHRAKVKRVIQLFMNGGGRPMDTWDYKPALTKLDGQKLGSKTKIEGATGMQGALMKSPFEFKQHGQCGKWVSSVFPEQAKLVDEMAFLQAMAGRSNVHGQNAYLLNNGFLLPGFPCMGAWISYALGSLSDNLPGFIVLPDARGLPYNGRGCFTAGFLPAVHQGTVIKADSPQPIADLFASDKFAYATRCADADGLALLNQMNRAHTEQHPGDSRLAARVAGYELAAKMQLSAPEAFDVMREPESARKAQADQFRAQLYNTQTDPAETKDVSAQHPEVVQELRDLLNRYRNGGYSRELPPVVAVKPTSAAVLPAAVGTLALNEPLAQLPAKPWTMTSGKWLARDGAVWGTQLPTDQNGAALRTPCALGEGTVDFELNLDGASRISLRIEAGDSAQTFRVVISRAAVEVARNPARGETQAEPLARKPLELQKGRWYPVRLTFTGNHLAVQVNDTQARATHAIFANPKSALNFLVFGEGAGFKNVMVRK